jgi:tetraacyldisaccharide 4'-kinase
MRAPAFWWRPPGLEAALLRPVAALYGAVAQRRLLREGERGAVPVVCVGDPTVGGAGKTPTAIKVAELLAAAGERPVFLTRGFRGRLNGPVQVDAQLHDAEGVGDEPLLLARKFPTIVAHDRVAGAHAAHAQGAGVIVMDDGFQNPSLAKDCSVLVVDGARGIGNGAVVPAGPLRAPLAAQLGRAHALVVIGAGEAGARMREIATQREITVFGARLKPDASAIEVLRGKSVLAFAGIGHPEKFFDTLTASGIDTPVRRGFADHHAYTQTDAAGLLREAERQGLVIATTEKDQVRLGGAGAAAELKRRAIAVPVTLRLDDEAGFGAFVLGRVKTRVLPSK